ncbi:heme NO-binding domain-containing protein [Shewanella sp. VB17]|uniref:heme NO-binding domain-containing protein n=1 Tax=Shewanella sp. VB17 TaxID=2739432 RepID=UPI0015665F39|nr:heme NO-binding domain-containing protein [Shewanella sp. VB17]NRD73723.1 heme NO-binding domain-containing protein [Shewanella sp. VB17]
MKGIIFSEFLTLVEDKFGLDICQQILDDNNDTGAYTSVGTYDHLALVKLIVSLSKLTGISVEQLQEVYGKSIFINLYQSMPGLEGKTKSTFEFVKSVEEYIHIEVKKLYHNAMPPEFIFISETKAQLVMDYHSARCLSHVCLGLLHGCAEHFNEKIHIDMDPLNPQESEVRFCLTLGE